MFFLLKRSMVGGGCKWGAVAVLVVLTAKKITARAPNA
jgi:hypothetical protein